MRILFLPSEYLPMPPVKGGAVQTLLDNFLKWNEKYKQHEIVVYSIENRQARQEAKKYESVKFRYVNTDTFFLRARSVFRRVLKRICGIKIEKEYIYVVNKAVENEKFDLIISENVEEFGFYLRKNHDEKLVLHLHNERLRKEQKDSKKLSNAHGCISTLVFPPQSTTVRFI